jgi:hypothetical protein
MRGFYTNRTLVPSAFRSSSGSSQFTIAATVLELDEPAPLVVVIVSHASRKCFDDLCQNGDQHGLAQLAFTYRDLVS